MLKVLIADDEPKVCKLITCLIDWDSLDLEISGIVHNGESALDFLANHTVDIIITDIRMPGINGLELIEHARELNHELHFIIISGYKHFEYAQKAIKYGVEDYILKPIKEKELLLCLKKIIDKKRAILENQEETTSLKDRLHSDMKKARLSFFNEIIRNPGVRLAEDSVEQINTQYHFHFGAPYYIIMMIQPIFFGQTADEQLITFFTAKIEQLLYSAFPRFQELLVSRRNQTVYGLFNGTTEDIQFLRSELKALRGSIQELRDVFTRMKIYIFLCLPHKQISELPDCMQEVLGASFDRFITFNSIIEYTPTSLQQAPKDLITLQYRKNFLTAVETLNSDMLTELIENLTKTLLHTAESGKMIHDIYLELLDLFEFGIKNYNHNIDYMQIIDNLKSSFQNHINVNELMADFLSEIKQSFQNYKLEKSQEMVKPIRLAKEYIQLHYAEPLSLDIMGNEIGLNPAYFSSVFKKETGSSFVDYLNEVRIENAKQILLDNGSSLTEICEAVGFNDIKYFKKRFRKSTGLSPSEYRKLYS